MISTKKVKIDPLNPQEEYIKEAAGILAAGGLVIIPTETVYGIAANALNPKAIEKLYKIKERPKDKPFSLHIAGREKIEEFACDIPIFAYKLMSKIWPGPLTLILRAKTGGVIDALTSFSVNGERGRTIGIRVPDNEVALRIIKLSGVPVVCPSANISGKPAPVNFTDAIKDLDGLVDFAIDSGATKLQVESSVVDCAESSLRVLREAAIKKEVLEAVARRKTVLFVCTGNSCRSVMAEALLKKKLKERNRGDVEVLSAGVMMMAGLGATEATKEILKKEGIDVSSHRSRMVTKELLRKSDIILVMEKLHEERILQVAADVQNRLFLLKEFVNPVRNLVFGGVKKDADNLDIIDPIANSMEFYAETCRIIKQAVERVSDII
mgnify:CR=1 FL=1